MNKLIEQIFLGVMSFLCAFGVYFLKDLGQEVAALNQKMAVVLVSITTSETNMKDHESRIRTIEEKIYAHGRSR